MAAALVVGAAGCARDTSKLTPEWTKRFDTEGIVRRADNVVVRHTREDGRYENTYKDRLASIIVTHGTVLIHQNDRVLLELTSRTRRAIKISRSAGRIRIRAEGQRIVEVFSFEPPDSAAGWAEDIRKVEKQNQESE